MRRRSSRSSLVLLSALLWLGSIGCEPIAVTPATSAPGQVLSVTGADLGDGGGATDAVLYGDVEARVLSWSPSEIRVVTPELPDGAYALRVRSRGRLSGPVRHELSGPFAILTPRFEAGTNSLRGRLLFRTSRPASGVAVEVTGPEETWAVPETGLFSEGTEHEAWVLGLAPDTDYRFTIQASDGAETVTDDSLTHSSDALDPRLPPIEVTVAMPSEMEPGLTLFGVTRFPFGFPLGAETWVVAVDAAGTIRWYQQLAGETVEHVEQLPNGDLLLLRGIPDGDVLRIDPMGELVAHWSLPGDDVLHHYMKLLPNGDLLALATEHRFLGGYPGGDGSSSHHVIGDRLVQLRPAGQVVRSLSLFDFLDPFRHPVAEFDFGFYDRVYGVPTKDWTHANSFQLDPRDGSVVISVRHQNLIVKLGGEPTRMIWALGEDDPTTTGDDDWPWLVQRGPGLAPRMQHGVFVAANGNVVVYDNGNGRPELASRAVEYEIDEAAGTFTEVWSWIDPELDPPLWSYLTGDADPQPGGTVLIADTGISFSHSAEIRLAEVRKADGLKVWELWIDDAPANYVVTLGFDVERIPSLYPSR